MICRNNARPVCCGLPKQFVHDSGHRRPSGRYFHHNARTVLCDLSFMISNPASGGSLRAGEELEKLFLIEGRRGDIASA